MLQGTLSPVLSFHTMLLTKDPMQGGRSSSQSSQPPRVALLSLALKGRYARHSGCQASPPPKHPGLVVKQSVI
jgi:hypothetical protein